MSMIKIDGAKIKQLREQQGLTQLYLATAVQVTTDTISRWENKRYPSIKHENGLKLAESLGVDLKDLLLQEKPLIQETFPSQPASEVSELASAKRFPPLFYVVLGLLSAGIVGMSLVVLNQAPPQPTLPIQAIRVLPQHCSPQLECPVIIELSGEDSFSGAAIVTESLPESATLLKASPELTTRNDGHQRLKWLQKFRGATRFAYTFRPEAQISETLKFVGSVTTRGKNDDPPLKIGGDRTIKLSKYHWADTNLDNVISDGEILTVYDIYSDIKDLNLDIDTIEKIWLGSGYRFDSSQNGYIVLK